jgi:hypothetical protein
MDTLLEYFYHNVRQRCWNNSAAQKETLKEWETAKDKSWSEICDAAQILAEQQSFAIFLAAFHLGFSLETSLWRQMDQLF